jgi:hypothetical protein
VKRRPRMVGNALAGRPPRAFATASIGRKLQLPRRLHSDLRIYDSAAKHKGMDDRTR